MRSDMYAYTGAGLASVEGWLDHRNVYLLDALDKIQTSNRECAACEIGVHHGKFFLLLHSLRSTKTSLAIDLFDDQEKNLDRSGCGSLTTFLSNVNSYSPDPSKVSFLATDSLAINSADISAIRDKHGLFSLFSIDGGHTSTHVTHDYHIASELTAPGGVIMVDDYPNVLWPEVAEGISSLYFFGRPKHVPLICGLNKLYLIDMTHHGIYLKKLAAVLRESAIPGIKGPTVEINVSRRYGWECINIAG